MKNPSRNTKIGVAALVVALGAVGGAVAAGKRGGSEHAASSRAAGSVVGSRSAGAPHHGDGVPRLAVAARYLGLSATDLQAQLESGKTLAQIAEATAGKSKAGLIDALVAAEQLEHDQMPADARQRISDLVNGLRPPHADRDHRGPGGHLAAAATYLGLTGSELRAQIESGRTLAQIAEATAGKSKAGLIDALVADEQAKLAAAVEDGRLTQPQADQMLAGARQRLSDLVNGVRPLHGHDHR